MTNRILLTAAMFGAFAAAHPLTITFTGSGTGQIGSTPFTNAAFTITFTTDTSNLSSPAGSPNDLSTPSGTTAAINVAAVAANFTDTQAVFINPAEEDVGIWHYNVNDFLTIGLFTFETYNLGTSLGPVQGTTNTFGSGNTFSTSQGALYFTSVSNVSFQVTVTGPTPWKYAGAGNFNQLAGIDAVWQDPQTGAAQVYYLDGTTSLSPAAPGFASFTGGNAWRIAAIADFNQDGIPDLVWQDPVSGAAQVWYMTGTTGSVIGSTAKVSGANSWRIVGAADFNGDTHPDLLWQDPSSGSAQIWYMGGTGGVTFLSDAKVSGANSWRIVAIGDFNADTVPDLVWQDPSTGHSQIWYMNAGGATLNYFEPLTGPNPWRIVGASDFNGDTVPDLVWQNPSNNNVQIWFMGGTNGLTIESFKSLPAVQ